MIYISLFITAFIAATLFPTASEALLIALINDQYHLVLLWLSATCGNVLGSCLNWWIGKELNRFRNKPWLFFSEKQLTRAETHFNRFGKYALLFSWLPIVGDPLTLIAGILKVRFWPFLILVTIGKGLRYLFVILMTLGVVTLL